MKANELMIGDLCESFVDKEIVRIEWLNKDYPEVTYPNTDMPNGMILQHNYTQLTPISLTAEMLEKNGFEKYEMYHTLHERNVRIEYYWHESRLEIQPYDGEPWIKLAPIHYVHELQHALRLCGLTELADNFKVK